MEESTRFWKNWPTGPKSMLLAGGLMAIVVFIWFAFSYLQFPAPSIDWIGSLREENIEVPVQQFDIGPYRLQLKANNFILWQEWSGSPFSYSVRTWYAFTGVMLLCLALLLTIHSRLSRWWFYSLSGLLLFVTNALRPESLLSGSMYPVLTLALMAVWFLPGLVFQHLRPGAGWWTRLAVYTAVIAGGTGALTAASTEPEPVLLIGIGLLPSVLLLSVVFMLLTAHEFQAALVRWLGRIGGGQQLRDFAILSAIYLANLGATYSGERGWISWPYAIDPLFLLAFAGILGLWGVRHWERQAGGIFPAEQDAVLFRMMLFIVFFLGVGLMYATANDSVVTTARKLSLYIQIGFGAAFLFYVTINFGSLMLQQLPVVKVLYAPRVFNLVFYRALGLLITGIFIVFNIWTRPVNDLRGGYYNAVGDYYSLTGQTKFSDAYYEMASVYAFHNQHSNYILAGRAHDRYDYKKEVRSWRNAAERRPLAQAYVNLSNFLLFQNRPLDAYAQLKEARRRLPDNKQVPLMLGLIEMQLGSPDSALWNFERAGSPHGDINRTALLARTEAGTDPDSVLAALPAGPTASVSNMLALANRRGRTLDVPPTIPADSALDLTSATLLHNHIVNRRDSLNETELEGIMRIARHPANTGYSETLHAALALAAFQRGMTSTAFDLMERVTVYSDLKGRYNNQLATWALALGAPRTALSFSRYAVAQEYPDAPLTHAIALTEAGMMPEAVAAWQPLLNAPSAPLREMASTTLRVLTSATGLSPDWNDMERYAWCRYHPNQLSDTVLFRKICDRIGNSDLRARTVLEHAQWQFRNDRVNDAVRTYQRLSGMPIASERLFHDIQLLELRLLAWRGELHTAAKIINAGFRFLPQEEAERHYFSALLSAGDTAKVRGHFEWITRHNVWFEDGVLRAAEYLQSAARDPFAGNAVLARAMHVNPHSIRIRKAYITDCVRQGLTPAADIALAELARQISEDEFREFRDGLPAQAEPE